MKVDGLLTFQEVADVFGVRVGTIRDWVNQGRLPAVKPTPRVVRFLRRDVEALIRSTRTTDRLSHGDEFDDWLNDLGRGPVGE